MAPSAQSKDVPLVGSPKGVKKAPKAAPSSKILSAIKFISIVRIATGAVCLLAPRFTCSMHGYEISDEHALLVRMLGVRESVIGGLLLTAEDKESESHGIREIKRALRAGMVADTVDVLSLAFGFAMGQIGTTTCGIIGTAAVGAISLAAWMLRNL